MGTTDGDERPACRDTSGDLARWAAVALDALPQVTVLLVGADLRYRAVLGGGAARHGYDAAALVGRRVREVVGKAAWRRIEPMLASALNGATTSERFAGPATGHVGVQHLEATYTPAVDDGAVVGVLVVLREVSVHEVVVHDTSDVICTADAEGRFTWVSASCSRVTGWRPEQLVGRRVVDLVHPDDRGTVLGHHAQLLAGRPDVATEYRHQRPDGSWLWVESRVRALRGPDGAMTGRIENTRDVSRRHELQTRLAEAMAMFELGFAAAPIGKALVAPDGTWLKVNPALAAITGRTEAELLGSTFREITHPADLDVDAAELAEVLAGVRPGYQSEKRLRRPDGAVVWVLLSMSAARDATGAIRFLIAQVQDVTERRLREQLLAHRADHDPLTGLWNRRRLHDELERSVLACAAHPAGRPARRPTLLVVDLDGFKAVNDRRGHAAGDLHLRDIAEAVRAAVRHDDVCARLGGDEFGVLLRQADDGEATAIARRVVEHVAALGAGTAASVGLATWQPGQDTDTWLRRADQAMYAAKRSGGNRFLRAGELVAGAARSAQGEPLDARRHQGAGAAGQQPGQVVHPADHRVTAGRGEVGGGL